MPPHVVLDAFLEPKAEAKVDEVRASLATIPTLIAFFGGAPDYLKVALRSAAHFNSQVVLVGDRTNHGLWKDHWDSSRIGLAKFDRFKRSYVKMSDYPEFYEMAILRRPFVIEEWMRSEGVGRAILVDSDVVTFADYSADVVSTLPSESRAALMTVHDQDKFAWASSPHFSYWTLDALTDFTSFCIEAYQDAALRSKLETKYRWHVENRQPGGICDMTLLYLWGQRHEKRVWNLARVWKGMVGDLAVGTSSNYFQDEYVMRGEFKKFSFRNGIPYAFNKILSKDIRFLCVHCQGPSKGLMRFLYARRWRGLHAHLYGLDRSIGSGRATLKATLRPLLFTRRS